jgi:signal peptidase I
VTDDIAEASEGSHPSGQASTAGDAPGATVPAATVPPGSAGPPPTVNGSDGSGGGDAAPKGKGRRINRTLLEWGLLLVAAVVLALVIKAFLFQAFYIPSESMVPTLKVGDRVLVNKLSYDLHDVHRGDIVVFTAEPNPGWRDTGITDLVKRVIGLPGETITECPSPNQGTVCINGRQLKESYLPKGTVTTFPETPQYGCAADSPPNGCHILPGHYFVMGDNRTRSADARLHGPIKESSIVGRVFVRIWPLNRLGFL